MTEVQLNPRDHELNPGDHELNPRDHEPPYVDVDTSCMSHVPSPQKLLYKDENEIINPAVNGTLSVLQASHKHRVKRVVYTSSIAAILGDYSTKDPPGKVFTEDDWTDTESAKDAYIKAKTLAERAAWNFVAELPEGERFELAVLNPTGVFGPVLCGEPETQGKVNKRFIVDLPISPAL